MDYLDEALRLLRNFGRLIFWMSLLIIIGAAWGVWHDSQGQLAPLLAGINLKPPSTWGEFLVGVVVTAAFFLLMGLVMLFSIGSLKPLPPRPYWRAEERVAEQFELEEFEQYR